MLIPTPPVSNAERQRRFRERNPGYYGRLHARRRAGTNFAAAQYPAAAAAEAMERETLALPAPAEAIEVPGINMIPMLSSLRILSRVMDQRISIYDLAAIDQLRRELRLDPRDVRKLRNDLLKRYVQRDIALADFPAADRIAPSDLQLHDQRDSAIDGATKLLFRTPDGLLIESVILRLATGRTTLCVSSQVGCAAACEFCATGKMGLARNLSANEILDQVLLAGRLLTTEKRSIRNIVFMGMGEPFHNEKNLFQALDALISPKLFHYSPKKILVSTVGVADAMLRCAKRFPSVNLALSLHSVRQSVRERLIPLAKKYPLDQIRWTVAELNRVFGVKVMIEYLMLKNVNDSTEDAGELIAWLDGLNVHINLIPFNPIDDSRLVGSDQLTRESFALQLKAVGLKTTIRYSLGNDIAAACGQLVRSSSKEDRGLPPSAIKEGLRSGDGIETKTPTK